jgi:GntR family transcriptional repressor for pyruvate dehydrogenase complex
MAQLEAESLTDTLIRSIQDAIRLGEYLPGDTLPSHPQLAARYGVGLSTVREAIKALALIGLVDVRSGRGTRVLPDAGKVLSSVAAVGASIGHVEFEQAYEARAAIEIILARRAAEWATETDLEQMRQALDDMRAQIADTDAFLRADWRFHLTVAEAARNPILYQMYQLASGLLRQMLESSLLHPGSKERGITHQEQLLEAIAHHDPEHAEHCAQEHMYSFRTDWLASMRAGGRPD